MLKVPKFPGCAKVYVANHCAQCNATRWPSTRVQPYGPGRIHPRARCSIRPATIRICGGSNARGVPK